MTRDEIKQKASISFLLNPNNSEEEKDCVIDKVMSTRATIVSKAALCNIITYMQKQNSKLEAQIEQLQKINNKQKETLKKVRVALIQERTANIMNYGKGGVEMFDSMFEILKGVSN